MRLRAGLLVAPLVLGALSACGSGAAAPAITVETLQRGAETMATSTARMSGTSVRGEGSDVERFRLEGAFDGATHSSRFLAVPDPSRADVGSTETLVVDGTLYTRLWDSTAEPGRWLAYPPDSELAELQAMWLDSANPFAFVDQLRSVASFEVKDTESIDGVETTHVEVHVDAEKWMARLPESLRKGTRTSDTDDEDLVFDAWVDGDGVVRRTVSRNSRRPSTTTVDYYDLGSPVTIEAPPASEVVDANDPVAMAEYVRSLGPIG